MLPGQIWSNLSKNVWTAKLHSGLNILYFNYAENAVLLGILKLPDLLRLLSHHNSIIKEHLEYPQMKNATYISTKTQNQILSILSDDFLLYHPLHCPH